MATGLLALIDDIVSVLDDVAAMTKVAAQKTAAIAGDDLAVGAEAMVGLHPSRELPIVWSVTKGSLLNKAWLVPAALVLTLIAPWSLTPLLMFGGAFLCYEGVHKVIEKFGGHHGHADDHATAEPKDAAATEKARITGAIRTDVILSAEIIVIALNTMNDYDFGRKALALSVVALGMTAIIYGLIAIIVKADDVGLHLVKKGGPGKALGRVILVAMPPFMKLLGIVGTIAMFLVGGGIMVHGIPGFEPALHHVIEGISTNGTLVSILTQVATALVGIVVGFVVIGFLRVFGPSLSRAMAAVKGRFAKKKA